MRTSPTSHRLTAANADDHWAIKYVQLKHIGSPARHRMTRATLRRHRAAQHRASRIQIHRPVRPMWARALQAAASLVF